MTEKEKHAALADRERMRLRKLRDRRRREMDEPGAVRASIGMTVAARIANLIRRS